MAKNLTRTVFVDGVAYRPGSAIPESVAKRIANPKTWADADDAPAPAGVVADLAGSFPSEEAPSDSWTVKELTAFAKAHDVDLAGARTKEPILAALAAASHGAEADDDGTGDPEAADGGSGDEQADPDADGADA